MYLGGAEILNQICDLGVEFVKCAIIGDHFVKFRSDPGSFAGVDTSLPQGFFWIPVCPVTIAVGSQCRIVSIRLRAAGDTDHIASLFADGSNFIGKSAVGNHHII